MTNCITFPHPYNNYPKFIVLFVRYTGSMYSGAQLFSMNFDAWQSGSSWYSSDDIMCLNASSSAQNFTTSYQFQMIVLTKS